MNINKVAIMNDSVKYTSIIEVLNSLTIAYKLVNHEETYAEQSLPGGVF